MNWSQEQEAIFEYARTGQGNRVVQARAGTGKTTTVKEMFRHCPEDRILYAVFNKRNQKEAESKIKDHRVDVKTLHSLGYAFIRRVWSGAKPDDEVEVDRILFCGVREDDRETVGGLIKLVGFAKNTTVNPNLGDMEKIADDQDIEFGWSVPRTDAYLVALDVMEKSKVKDPAGRISFNDMVWLPVAMNWVKPIYDLVCIDEAQDMNLPQLVMARQASKGRIIVVGDNRQAIYGFRGAVQEGMEMMRVTLRAETLSLTTTYRCPKLVVRDAAEIVPDYHAAPEAPEGSVQTITETVMAAQVAVGDAVLSRLNAPLMPLALSFLRRNIPARIEGKDIGKQLIGMVKSMRAKSVQHFIERVEAWASKQRERLQRARNAEKKIESVNDIAQTLTALAEGASSVNDIDAKITTLFQDTDANSKPAVVLSTVHKAKGLEWPRVFILRETFRRGKGQEEDNIFYVAITRSMHSLYYVQGRGQVVSEKSSLIPAGESKSVMDAPGASNQPVIERAASADPVKDAPLPGTAVPDIEVDSYSIPQGMVLRKVGDMIKHSGSVYVCDLVNHCRARFVNGSGSVSLSICCEPASVIRRLTKTELRDFLAGETRLARNKSETGKQTTTENKEDSMSKKTETKTETVDKKAGKVETKTSPVVGVKPAKKSKKASKAAASAPPPPVAAPAPVATPEPESEPAPAEFNSLAS